jgi:hypothetical protein
VINSFCTTGLHLHHEDFIGQYGKILWILQECTMVYRTKKRENLAAKLVLLKFHRKKELLPKKIRDFVHRWWLHVCDSATDSFDITLADGMIFVNLC